MYGIDISNHQRGIRMKEGSFDFVIMKATEGVGFIDKSFSRFVNESISLGKMIGAYHYARPDLQPNVTAFKNEAFSFVDAVEKAGIIGTAILVLDYEVKPFDIRCEELICAFLETVEIETGVKPFIYGSYSKLRSWQEGNYTFMRDAHLWVARWRNDSSVVPVHADIESAVSPMNGIIWQYTSQGIFPGVSSIDLDITTLTPDQWIKMAGKKTTEPFDYFKNSGIFPKNVKKEDNLSYESLANILDKLL